MERSSSTRVDVSFRTLHQSNAQNLNKSFRKYPMNREIYFYDQFTRVSHLGGLSRHKRHSEELNQALHHVRIALAAEDNEPANSSTPTTLFNPTPSPVKQQVVKQTNESLLKTIQRKFNAPLIPDLLFRELDLIIQRFDDKSKTSTSSSTTTPKIPSSIPAKSAPIHHHDEDDDDDDEETDALPIQEADDEDELIVAQSRTPKVSLPASLILAFHWTWSDLIDEAEYTYRIWRTKAGEEFWRRRVENKRAEQINADKQRVLGLNKRTTRRRSSARESVHSATNLSRQQGLNQSQLRSNRSASRVSFVTTSNVSQLDNLRLLKSIPQGSLESLTESVKSGIHVEFKLSIQADELKQEQSSIIQSINEQKGFIFDISKPTTDVHEDVIALMQHKCKRLLAEMKRKISATGMEENPKMCKIWFYGENQHIRNKTNLLTLNESMRKMRSKFIFTLLRREIPDRYQIEITLPENKHKSLMETIDGTIQIYYPSGRLAVLRLNSPSSVTLLFDDTEIVENQFVGLVTSTGNMFIMQPTLHARFTTDSQRERAYLCNGISGIIEKQIQWNLNNSIEMDEDEVDDILPPLFQTSVQLQLNSFMQLEFHDPTNIRFAFACQKEEYKFQLGTTISPSPPIQTITPNLNKKTPTDSKKTPTKSKLSNNSNENPIVNEKQQIQIERLLDGQVNLRELPMIKELNLLRKRIRHLLNNWLREFRIALGVMDIDSYCFPDWPPRPQQLNAPLATNQMSKSAKSPRHLPIPMKQEEFLQNSEREQILRRFSARRTESNVIADTMMQFIPRSTSARIEKPKTPTRKISSPKHLPAINKTPRTAPSGLLDESFVSPRIGMSIDVPFGCPIIVREHLIHETRLSHMIYDTCVCRSDQVPLIRDLEFDTLIQLINRLNPKQLIVVGIINSNLRQIENDENDPSNDLYQIFHTLHYHLNYGRSQICACRLATNDDYRCFIYDLAQATKQSSFYGPLLVRRHHVQPGFVLIYQNGKLIFGDSIFNGYGRNVQDLKKQLNHIKQQQVQHNALPDEFKFISDHQRTNPTILKSV